MATDKRGIDYWDPWTSSTDTAGSSTTSPTDTYATDTATGGRYYYIQTVRKLLVPRPENWTDENQENFLRLVNIDTNTGWKVTMVIQGKILITDPDVEIRKMKDFYPLMKQYACSEDKIKINKFIEENPIK